jgi:hypothetical protein
MTALVPLRLKQARRHNTDAITRFMTGRVSREGSVDIRPAALSEHQVVWCLVWSSAEVVWLSGASRNFINNSRAGDGT